MMRIFSAVAASIMLATTPALHAADPVVDTKKLMEIRYGNYILCQAYSLMSADSLEAAGKDKGGTLENAAGFKARAAILQKELQISDHDTAVRLNDSRMAIYSKTLGLDDQGVAALDDALFNHCSGVAMEEDGLYKEWTW